jgi:hypothetical protein
MPGTDLVGVYLVVQAIGTACKGEGAQTKKSQKQKRRAKTLQNKHKSSSTKQISKIKDQLEAQNASDKNARKAS